MAGFLSESVWLAGAVINNGENRKKINNPHFIGSYIALAEAKSLYSTQHKMEAGAYFEFCSPRAENLKI